MAVAPAKEQRPRWQTSFPDGEELLEDEALPQKGPSLKTQLDPRRLLPLPFLSLMRSRSDSRD